LPGYWGDARPTGGGVSALSRSRQRLAPTAGLQRVAALQETRRAAAYSTRFTPEILRAMMLASTLTATAIGAGLLWMIW
jgi:hypothetical protein